jgi:hypothetical protein
MAIQAKGRRQFEISEVKTETWPRIGQYGLVLGEAKAPQQVPS